MEKSASRTTFAHGPGQDAGGVKENNLGEKSAKAILLKSCTTQGVVCGRGTGGSAVAVFGEPITNPGAGMACAELAAAASMSMAITKALAADIENEIVGSFARQSAFIVQRGFIVILQR